MAFLYIAEFNQITTITNKVGDEAQAALNNLVTEQKLIIGGASIPSAIFQPQTKLVRLHTDVVCSILFGFNPVATIANMRMATNQTEYFGVYPGTQVAVIQNV